MFVAHFRQLSLIKNVSIYFQKRWNNGDVKSKELKAMTDMVDDEKNPDVIPQGKSTEKSSSVNSSSACYGKDLVP